MLSLFFNKYFLEAWLKERTSFLMETEFCFNVKTQHGETHSLMSRHFQNPEESVKNSFRISTRVASPSANTCQSHLIISQPPLKLLPQKRHQLLHCYASKNMLSTISHFQTFVQTVNNSPLFISLNFTLHSSVPVTLHCAPD